MVNALRLLSLIFLISCAGKQKELLTLNFEKDLFPEGIALDPITKTIFINSLRYHKIMKCGLDGSNPESFIGSNQYGYLSGFGMTVKGDTLFALSNSLPPTRSQSLLLLLNTKTGSLINSYSPVDTTFKYLNDLTVTSQGDIFITDSESNKLYTIQHSTGTLEVFLESDAISNSNGITISDDQRYLYLASGKGIRVLDKSSKTILNESNPTYNGIDGLKYYENSLIGIVNGKKNREDHGVYRYFLNKENTAIVRVEKLISFDNTFKVPTTFAIFEDHIYFIVNSQIDNYDGELNQILNDAKLEPHILMKLRIDSGEH